jgi:hypothetical protein
MSTTKVPEIAKLGPNNYPQWSGEMQAWLRASQLWRLVSGDLKCPTMPDKVTDEYTTKNEQWLEKAEKASGWIYLMVEPEQRIHLTGIQDDPVKMWTKLEEIHMAKKAGARFNAYDDLFSIRKKEEESLMSVTNRIDSAMRTIQNLRPQGFTLDKLDEELTSMAMIRSLPDDYASFVSSLLVMDKLEKSTIQQAFHTEETQRRRRAETESSDKALSTVPQPSTNLHCDFCDRDGHILSKCYKYLKAQKDAKKPHSQKKDKARAAAEDVSKVQESAGVVSLHTTTTSKTHDDSDDDELGFTVIDVDPDLDSEEFAGISAGTDPRTYKQAMNSPDVLHWKKAMLEEINALLQNGTWEIVRLPEGEKAIGSGWGIQDQMECRWLY